MSKQYPGGIRLTQRDHQALAYLTHLRAVRLDDLAKLLAKLGGRGGQLGVRTTRDIVSRWVACGYASTHDNPRGGLCVVTLTKSGADLVTRLGAHDPERKAEPVARPLTGLPAWRDIPHDLTVSAVAVWLITEKQCWWRGVAGVREQLPFGAHLPDGVAGVPNGVTMAIEVERHAKSRERWRENIGQLIDQWDMAVYFAPEAVQRSLMVWVGEHLPERDAARVRILNVGELAR